MGSVVVKSDHYGLIRPLADIRLINSSTSVWTLSIRRHIFGSNVLLKVIKVVPFDLFFLCTYRGLEIFDPSSCLTNSRTPFHSY